MKRPNTWMTLAVLTASAMTASCAIIVGFDKNYQETSSSGTTGAPPGITSSSSGGGGDVGVSASSAGGGSSMSTTGAGGAYVGPPSCAGLPVTCGPNKNEDCCARPKVPGGTFNRDRDANSDKGEPLHPATVTDFYLDRFEVTVGRFRRFADAYPGSKPAPGAGANPKVPNSGWNSMWDNLLPVDKTELQSAMMSGCGTPSYPTWTDKPDPNKEQLPINCNPWFVAFAFCAWDGGRLPSEVEWNYAAAGGPEQRIWPWGSADIDTPYASFNCLGYPDNQCNEKDIFPVGSFPMGDGLWKQADLGGNMSEWMFDSWSYDYPKSCVDCAVINTDTDHVWRGGGWYGGGSDVENTSRKPALSGGRFYDIGFRCARDKP